MISITALAFLLAACGSKTGSGADAANSSVAASVNGKEIMLSDVERIINQQTEGQQGQLSSLQLAAARLQVLDNLIRQQVLFQRAEKENLLPKDAEIDSAINQQKSNLTQEEWEKTLKANNMTEQAVREEARKALAIKSLQEKTVGKITISDRQVEDYYNNNKSQFVNARGVGLSAIVVDPTDNGLQDDAKSEEEAKLKIDRLHSQLKSGADFASVARASSEDQTNLRGGDLGFATEDDLKQNGFAPELVGNFFGAMQIGSYTAPVRFNNGRWYIFKLTNRNLQNENLTLDSPGVRDRIKEALRSQQQELLNAALVTTAMNEAKVENFLARNMLNDPNSLNALRPANASTTPATAASPAASPAATATPAATQKQ
ncbi:MAG TPA: SurA N-terminal domain-containing protein [Pyrinomonadaceae bacterium]|jgi:peptidyl-prolyl cis-trans isomerase SurA